MILRENLSRRENTRCRPRYARISRTGTDWARRRVNWSADSRPCGTRGRKKDVLSPFACAIFPRRERGRSDEWRSYLPGGTGDTATLIRAPCNGKPMNFSSPLATLSFWHACAPISCSSSLSSRCHTAGNPPASGFASYSSISASRLMCASILPVYAFIPALWEDRMLGHSDPTPILFYSFKFATNAWMNIPSTRGS